MANNFSKLVKIMDQLRGETGCPWDKEQTQDSLKTFLLEEVYEVLEAIEAKDPKSLRDELGDLLLQIVFQSQIAKERNQFDAEDVVNACIEKLVRRHPHVFGDKQVRDSGEVLLRWEELKRQERGEDNEDSLLDSLPKALPALVQAQRVQERVSRVGFDWPTNTASPIKTGNRLADDERIKGILGKVREEMAELQEAIKKNQIGPLSQEIGDLFFSLVNLARAVQIDAEGVLRETTHRFIRRFKEVQKGAKVHGKLIQDLSLNEMDRLWEKAKETE